MIQEVALITISCVLFVQSGLCGTIEALFHTKLPVVSCPKCLTMWTCLLYMVLQEYDIVVCVATSFIASYSAQWLSLVFDAAALLYNYLYEQVTKNPDTSSDAEMPDSTADTQADSDEVSLMQ